MSDVDDEIALLQAMFGDECRVGERNDHRPIDIDVDLGSGFMLRITLPGKYPAAAPLFNVRDGPNAVARNELELEIRKFASGLDGGVPVLVELVMQGMELASAIGGRVAAELAEAEAELCERKQSRVVLGDVDDEDDSPAVFAQHHIFKGEPIRDRKSKFVAYVADCSSVARVHEVLTVLRSRPKIAAAAHPAIYAYTFVDPNGLVHSDCDDDGEDGASRKMMFLLEHLGAKNCVVVVTRWFGGILLGPDRFKHIAAVTRDALIRSGRVKPG